MTTVSVCKTHLQHSQVVHGISTNHTGLVGAAATAAATAAAAATNSLTAAAAFSQDDLD